MNINKRYEPKEGHTISDLLLHQELLIMWNNMLLDIVKRTANINTAIGGDKSLQDDAIHLLKDIGEL